VQEPVQIRAPPVSCSRSDRPSTSSSTLSIGSTPSGRRFQEVDPDEMPCRDRINGATAPGRFQDAIDTEPGSSLQQGIIERAASSHDQEESLSTPIE